MNIEPGQIYYDRDGVVRGAIPATYLILSRGAYYRDRGWEGKAARFERTPDWMRGYSSWGTAEIVVLGSTDIESMEYVGVLPADHLRSKTSARYSPPPCTAYEATIRVREQDWLSREMAASAVEIAESLTACLASWADTWKLKTMTPSPKGQPQP